MSSGEQANQQPPALENFLIVAYRSLRKREKEPTRTNQKDFPVVPEVETIHTTLDEAIVSRDYKIVVQTPPSDVERRGGREHTSPSCWVGFIDARRCVKLDICSGKLLEEVKFDQPSEIVGTVSSLNWALYKDLFVKVTNAGVSCYKYTAGTSQLELMFASPEMKFAVSYMNMGSANLGRNLQITSRGIMLFATGNRFITALDLESIHKHPTGGNPPCLKYNFERDIGEFVCSFGKHQRLAVIGLNGKFFSIKIPSKFKSGTLIVEEYFRPINVKMLDNERITCLQEVPKYSNRPIGESDGRGWLTGSLTSDSQNPLCITFRNHQSFEAIDRLNLMQYGSGAGPLHSIRAVPGSKWAVYLVFSDLSYFHLISLTRQKLGIIQGRVSLEYQQTTSAAFRTVRSSSDTEWKTRVHILIPNEKSLTPACFILRLP